MEALLGRPNIKRRRKWTVSVGESDDPADFLVALANVEAEVGCVDGRRLKGIKGIDLPPILDDILTREQQLELREATHVMRGFHAPKFGHSATVAFAAPMSKTWDLDALEKVFRKVVGAVAPRARAAISTVSDEANEFDERTDAMDPSSRTMCLWSSLLHLAAECAVLKIRLRRRPAVIANA